MSNSTETAMQLEICASNIQSAVNARLAGADRIELCSALGIGGITPSCGAVEYSCALSGIETFVLIRPREGDFNYDEDEIRIMKSDIETAVKAGANGLVIGALDSTHAIDLKTTQSLIDAACGLPITFHRAFDQVADPFTALDQLIELKVSRVLTSGMATTAVEGSALLYKLVEHAAGEISIMPGAGINAKNIAQLASETGAKEFHLSATKRLNKAEYLLSMGQLLVSDMEEIKDVKTTLKNLIT